MSEGCKSAVASGKRRRCLGGVELISSRLRAEVHDSAVLDENHALIFLDIDDGTRGDDVLIAVLVLGSRSDDPVRAFLDDAARHVAALEIIDPAVAECRVK